ncbi:MAG: hypothetical protein ACR2OY_13870 [Boseongicola sp.]
MAQRIIMVHGRSTKPCKAQYAHLQKLALLQGLKRVSSAKAAKISDGRIPVDFVYYGDINNRILAGVDEEKAKSLEAKDPHSHNAPCLPATGYAAAIAALEEFDRFDRRAYRRVLAENTDLRFVDNAARAVSTLAAILTGASLNRIAIKVATADMGAYLMRRSVGSAIRERLQDPLRRALKRADDICLVSHSMGCMVAYDVLWKFSRMSEYRELRDTGSKINRWVTLGCPLGEAGVKANLCDAKEYDFQNGTDKHPKDIVGDWLNVAAVDDFISHDATMKNDYSAMLKHGYVNSITDISIYNCFTFKGTSNPHKLYGYLANPKCAATIADWIK